ncbi:MAG: hypothetical protein J0L62_11600 [Bacteroidetes bacterium]|nr:hypothetical protein [Bacteroidota bacterium]
MKLPGIIQKSQNPPGFNSEVEYLTFLLKGFKTVVSDSEKLIPSLLSDSLWIQKTEFYVQLYSGKQFIFTQGFSTAKVCFPAYSRGLNPDLLLAMLFQHYGVWIMTRTRLIEIADDLRLWIADKISQTGFMDQNTKQKLFLQIAGDIWMFLLANQKSIFLFRQNLVNCNITILSNEAGINQPDTNQLRCKLMADYDRNWLNRLVKSAEQQHNLLRKSS